MNEPATRFITLGTQRAGTTLVRTCLDSHPAIRCIGETFDAKYQGELGYRAWFSHSLMRRLRHRVDRQRLVREYLDHLYALPGYRAIGLKFMYNHTRLFQVVVPYVLEHRVRVIHVVRENALKTYVSRVAARARGRFHSVDEVAPVRVHVPVDRLLRRLDEITAEQRQWHERFEQHTPYLRLSYESFVAERDSQSSRMQAFLGVEHAQLASPLVKLTPDSLDQIILNYEEVHAVLQSSPHAHLLP